MGRVIESGGGGGAVRGHVAVMRGLIGVVCCSSCSPFP